MIRKHVFDGRAGVRDDIRWRGAEVSRLEALSDAVFGFAITLLVVSLEVPKTYAQLMDAMRGFVAFAASFALLFFVWFNQYRFFRRYGLEDNLTVALNAVLLFVVVFFVYPLKFVFTLVVENFIGRHGQPVLANGRPAPVFTVATQPQSMMVIFGLGYVAVFTLFALMHVRAYSLRDELALSPVERYETRANVREALLNAGIGVASILVALNAPLHVGPSLSGMTYAMVGPVMTVNGYLSGWRRKRLGLDRAAAEDADAESEAETVGVA